MYHIDLEIIFQGDLHEYELEKTLKYKLKSSFEYYIIYKHNS